MPGVRKADVSFSSKKAKVEYDPSQAKVEQLLAAIKKAGFTGKVK
ncbi:heavy-metal-associated domain-containing protein [Desulfobulbus sp. AH-315-M07]|nr:heavy-metal-associated domain-containing protein [Desulfobulbus sp. AH-315-M07]